MIRLVLVDDHVLVREGLRSLLALADDVQIVAEAADGEAAPGVIAAARPDVVLLDLSMPRATGLDVLRALKAAGGTPPAIILTVFDDEQALLEALALGAKGFLLKDAALDELLAAIRTVAAGGTYVRPVAGGSIAAGFERLPRPASAFPPLAALTEREVEVLRLLSGGYSNKEIAHALGVTEGTAKNHVSSVLSKLGVRDRTRAVLKAIEFGLL